MDQKWIRNGSEVDQKWIRSGTTYVTLTLFLLHGGSSGKVPRGKDPGDRGSFYGVPFTPTLHAADTCAVAHPVCSLVCANHHPEAFTYLKLNLQDTAREDISGSIVRKMPSMSLKVSQLAAQESVGLVLNSYLVSKLVAPDKSLSAITPADVAEGRLPMAYGARLGEAQPIRARD